MTDNELIADFFDKYGDEEIEFIADVLRHYDDEDSYDDSEDSAYSYDWGSKY